MWEEKQWQLEKYKWKGEEEIIHGQNSMMQGCLLKTCFPYPVCMLSERHTPSSVYHLSSSAFYLVCIDPSPVFTPHDSVLSNTIWTVSNCMFLKGPEAYLVPDQSGLVSPQRMVIVHHPQWSRSRGEPVECLRKASVGRVPACWQQRHLWHNILESWNLVKNDFRKSLGGNRKSSLTQVSKSQM